MELRPYQVDSIEQLSYGWKVGHKKQVLALTTGGGKTVIFTDIAKRTAERGKRVAIFTHRKELFEQANKTFTRIGISPELINAKSKNVDTDKLLYVCMVETICRRPKLIDTINPDLIIIDEAHMGNFTKVLDLFPDIYTIGVTATPIGKHFYEHYHNLVQTIDTPELIEQGYLVPCRAYQMVSEIKGLKKERGEFTEASQFSFYNQNEHYRGVVDEWLKYAKGKQTIVFNCNIEHSDNMAQEFNDAGIESYSITSNTPQQERELILSKFENGDFQVLNNASILTAGYDHPPIECIVINRATASLPLWLQMCGRGSRTFQGKSEFIVLDFGGNHNRHGLWATPRKWLIEPPKPKKQGETPVKECKECKAMVIAKAKLCPYCGYKFPEKEKELLSGTMEEVTTSPIGYRLSQLTIDQIVHISRSKNYNVTTRMLWRVLRSRGKDQLIMYANTMGYKRGWLMLQLQELNNNNYKDVIICRKQNQEYSRK